MTVISYVAIVVVLVITLLPSERDPGGVPGALLLLAASVGLILGSSVAWLFLVVVEVGNLMKLAAVEPWAPVTVKAFSVALLLAGSTRRHVDAAKLVRWIRAAH